MKKYIRVIGLILAIAALFTLISCGKKETELVAEDGRVFVPSQSRTDYICIQMENGDKIVAELYPESAPITVDNFQKLVEQGFYNGLIFHRVIPGFMIQGGCPEGTGFGDPGWSIKGEFSANGVDNPVSHERGVLSMARGNDPDSAGSQFFICHSTAGCGHLDGQYATFGRVIIGMDAVDAIATTALAGETPVEEQVMEKVYFVTPEA